MTTKSARDSAGILQCGEIRLCLLVVLQLRVLILADLLHRGDLAQKSLDIGGHDEMGGSVEASVLELGKSDLAACGFSRSTFLVWAWASACFNLSCARPSLI
jgi:hypothetical protein